MEFSSARWPILPIDRMRTKPFLPPPTPPPLKAERMHHTPSSAFLRTSTIAGRLFTFTFAFAGARSGIDEASNSDSRNKQQEGNSQRCSCNPWASVGGKSRLKRRFNRRQMDVFVLHDEWVYGEDVDEWTGVIRRGILVLNWASQAELWTAPSKYETPEIIHCVAKSMWTSERKNHRHQLAAITVSSLLVSVFPHEQRRVMRSVWGPVHPAPLGWTGPQTDLITIMRKPSLHGPDFVHGRVLLSLSGNSDRVRDGFVFHVVIVAELQQSWQEVGLQRYWKEDFFDFLPSSSRLWSVLNTADMQERIRDEPSIPQVTFAPNAQTKMEQRI